MLELYKNIKRLREQLNLSQEDLAKKTGYTSTSSITKIEKGKVDLSISKIILFAQSLNTTPADLMGWKDDNTKNIQPEKHPLMQIYDNLNNNDQQSLMSYAKYLLDQSQYKKHNPISEKEEISQEIC